MSSSTEEPLVGHLHVYPFDGNERLDLVADHYRDLVTETETPLERILVLTQLVDSRETERRLAETFDGAAAPQVRGFTDAALGILEAHTPGIELLSENARIEILADYLDRHDWGEPYLRDASDYESFQQDIGQLLIEADNQGGLDPEKCNSPALAEIARIGESFQSYLADHEYVDRSSILSRAADALIEMGPETATGTVGEWDVVLITDYEEVDPPKRRFLSTFTDAAGARVVGIAERASRILSTWNETGSVADLAYGLSVIDHGSEHPTTEDRPTAIARFLATGDRSGSLPTDGSVEVVEAPTFREQIGRVADEIERLCRAEGYTYEDFAVVFRDSQAPIGEAIRRLRRAGIPSTTVAVNQLGDDPAVRELYRVTELCASDDDLDDAVESVHGVLPELADTTEVLSEIQDSPAPAPGLWRWVRETQLKDRIAREYGELEARNQFGHVREAVELAAFLESAPELEASWERYLVALERAFQYSSSRYASVSTDREEGGVAVDTIYSIKNNSRKAVFLLNVTDEAYPFAPDLTALFPQSRLREEPDFPTLTDQSRTDVRATFPTGGDSDDDPFHDYFAQLSRRLLGVAAEVATDRLYFGIPREGTGELGKYQQPSRYLEQLVETFDFVRPFDESGDSQLTSHGQVSEFAVERVDETLEAIRRAGVGGDQVDLDTYEQELAAIQALLDNSEAETLRRAVEARIDVRHGRVRRE